MPTSVRVAIVGATGYAGEELLRLLLGHPHVQLSYLAASAKWERPTPASVVFPRFAGVLDHPIESLEVSRLLAVSDDDRPLVSALLSACTTCVWPTICSKLRGRYLRARTT